MSDTPRIEELKRRVQVDPASIAFAALAEEYRRAGRFDEAIATCQAGLQRHPAYLSAHVTLGRALLELGRFDEAREELAHVLRAAPENLAAIRGLAEIHHRRGELPEALEQYRSALQVAKHDAELEQRVDQIARQVAPAEDAAPVAVSSHPQSVVAVPSASITEDRVSAVSTPEPPPRPHLELVMRHPRAPEPEPEPQLQVSHHQPELHVSEAGRELGTSSEPEPELPASEPQPELLAPGPDPVWHASEPEAAMQVEPELEFHTATFDAPQPVDTEAAPLAPAAGEQETAWELPPEAVPARPDPALSALEGFLAAVLREKHALAATSADRR